jgi:tRNA pseudouridine55 synthase
MNLVDKEYEGVLLIDKPAGITSHDVVDRIRRKLRMKRVGHAGTLDPNATGLLILLIGKATKVSQFLMGLDKAYEGTICLGKTTDSQDVDGAVLTDEIVPELDKASIVTHMQSFLGDQFQMPPMFSAKKIQGVPLYKLARKGKTVEREPRFIRIASFDLLRWESPEIDFSVKCTKGTYIRTIAHDLGQKIGCGAYLKTLNRTAIDRFQIEDSIRLEALEDMTISEIIAELIPVAKAVPTHIR